MTIIKDSTRTSRARDAYDLHNKCITQAQSLLSMLPHEENSRSKISNKVIGDVVIAANSLMDKANNAADVMLSEVVD